MRSLLRDVALVLLIHVIDAATTLYCRLDGQPVEDNDCGGVPLSMTFAELSEAMERRDRVAEAVPWPDLEGYRGPWPDSVTMLEN